MHHCASAQGILRRLEQALRTAHSLVCPRIVTLAAGTTLMTVAAISVVVGVIELL